MPHNDIDTVEAVRRFFGNGNQPRWERIDALLDAGIGAERALSRNRFSPPRGAVCFSWDDGYAAAMKVAAIHDQRGQKATFAITKNLLDTFNHISPADVVELADAGHEIASHSVTHSNFVTQLTAAQRAVELRDSKSYIEGLTGKPCTTFVYPFGGAARNATTDQEAYLVYERFLDVAGNFGRPFNPLYMSPLHGRMDLTGTATNHAYAKNLIRVAATRRVVVSFLCHQLDVPGAPTSAQYEELCDLANSLDVPVVRTDEAFGGASSLADAGFEDPTLGAWNIVRDVGTQVVESVADTPVGGLSGERSLHLGVANGGFAYVAQSVELVPAVGYTLSGRYRTSASAGSVVTARLRQYGFDGIQVGGAPVGVVLAEATTWTRFSYSFTPNASALSVGVELLLDPASGAADAWIDHVHFGPTALGSFG